MLGNIFPLESFQASHEEAFLGPGHSEGSEQKKEKKWPFSSNEMSKIFKKYHILFLITTFFKKFVDQDVVLVKVGPAVLSVWRCLDHNHCRHCHHHPQYHHNEHHPDLNSWLSSSPGCGAFHASCMEEEVACVPVCLCACVPMGESGRRDLRTTFELYRSPLLYWPGLWLSYIGADLEMHVFLYTAYYLGAL